MIQTIINSINSAILLHCTKLDVSVRGLAQPVYILDDDEQIIPAITLDGEDSHVFIDDSYIFGSYHKLNGKTYSHETKTGYGDAYKVMCVADLSMIVWGFEKNIAADDMEKFIFTVAPKDMIFLKTDFDKKRVFQSEFSGVDFFVPEDVFLFKINYRVQYEVKKACLEIPSLFS
jgi:hypothetical protein